MNNVQHDSRLWSRTIGRWGLIIFVTVLYFTSVPVQAKQYEVSAYDIDMRLTDTGSYIVTETITFHFMEGAFSKAHRTISRDNFTSIRFISLQGVQAPVISHDVQDGTSLHVEWTYAETHEPRTFILTYEVLGGLQSENGYNIISWKAVDTDWDVPLNNIVVTLRLPKNADNVNVSPAEDLVDAAEANLIVVRRETLPPNTLYRVIAEFPKMVSVANTPPPPFGTWALAGLIVGLIVAIIDFVLFSSERITPSDTGPAVETFSPAELALITKAKLHRTVPATLFALALNGRIRFKTSGKQAPARNINVSVEILDDNTDNEQEQIVLRGLKKTNDIASFLHRSKHRTQLIRSARKLLRQKGMFDTERLKAQRRALVVSFPPLLLGSGALIYGFVTKTPVIVSIAIIAMLVGLSRALRAAVTVTLSEEGLFVREVAKNHVQQLFKQFEANVRRHPARAVNDLLTYAPYLLLHARFGLHHVQTLKQSLRDADDVQLPKWIDATSDGTDELTATLTALEQLDTVMTTVIAATAVTSSGSGAPPTTGGGGGAG